MQNNQLSSVTLRGKEAFIFVGSNRYYISMNMSLKDIFLKYQFYVLVDQGLSLSLSLNYFTHVERGSNLNYAMHSHLQDSIRLLNPIFIISSFIRNGAKLSVAIYIPWFMEK